MSDYLPHTSLALLRQRAQFLKRIRSFFDDRDFIEVTTPVLSSDTVVDEHLDPLSTICFHYPAERTSGPTRYLQTSPEFLMKRLVTAGLQRIYQIGPAFRGAESGTIHNTEFTMLEWYRVGDAMEAGMDLLAELAAMLFSLNSASQIRRSSYCEVFRAICHCDPWTATLGQLDTHCAPFRPATAFHDSDTRDDRLDLLWSHKVQPALGRTAPVIVYDFPSTQAGLARIREDSQPGRKVAERFELYFRGIELANGYHELTDPVELERRNREINQRRKATGKPPMPETSRLLDAMRAGMPDCSGVALGVDRALMVATGSQRLDQVMPFTDSNA